MHPMQAYHMTSASTSFHLISCLIGYMQSFYGLDGTTDVRTCCHGSSKPLSCQRKGLRPSRRKYQAGHSAGSMQTKISITVVDRLST